MILHLDMDAFFASVEQLDAPQLQGRPVIIGNSLRGVASAASYEARSFGVHSAMPIARARRLCPHGVFLPVRMSRYKEVSAQVMSVLQDFSPVVEQASVDEAYLDISGTERLFGPPRELARALKDRIRTEIGLTCSAGVAPVRFLAKIASDWDKPDGLTVVEPDRVQEFLARVPVDRIPGIGKRAREELRLLQVNMVPDILNFSESFWVERFGKRGAVLYRKAKGIDPVPVLPRQPAKSCSAENTFSKDTMDPEELKQWLITQSERVGRDLRRGGYKGRTITLKLKFADFTSLTRNTTLSRATDSTQVIIRHGIALLRKVDLNKKVRLIGIGVSGFDSGPTRGLLFPNQEQEKQDSLDAALDRIADKYGTDIVGRAAGKSFKS
jgi:DNA polymerase-4